MIAITKERPILFSAPMVLATLDDRKTLTRRIAKGITALETLPSETQECLENRGWSELVPGHLVPPCPYGKPGDQFWVRETSRAEELPDGLDGVRYMADNVFRPIENSERAANDWITMHNYRGNKAATVPAIHMPRWASRIQLLITDIQIERLNDIDENDCLCEGIEYTITGDPYDGDQRFHCKNYMANGSVVFKASENKDLDEDLLDTDLSVCPQESFKSLWQSIHGADSWDKNPWVWVIQFERVDAHAVAA